MYDVRFGNLAHRWRGKCGAVAKVVGKTWRVVGSKGLRILQSRVTGLANRT